MDQPIFAAILERLKAAGVDYRHLQHEPTRTCEASALARNESLHIGGKSLVLKVDEQFVLLVLSAAQKAHSPGLRRAFGTRRIRFASAVELAERTGLPPGSVPPFGAPILPLPLYLDRSILANELIAFNAGSLTDSVIMRVADWLPLANVTQEIDLAAGQGLRPRPA